MVLEHHEVQIMPEEQAVHEVVHEEMVELLSFMLILLHEHER